MYCPNCAAENDDDAKYCEKCGAALPVSRPAVESVASPTRWERVYIRSPRSAWWYPLGAWAILSAFFLFLDLVGRDGTVDWAYWPIGILGIFMVGFPLLNMLDARARRR